MISFNFMSESLLSVAPTLSKGKSMSEANSLSRSQISLKDISLFLEKVSKSDAGCWEFVCNQQTHYKYFLIYNDSFIINARAHRVSYVIHNGDISKGLIIRHTCDNPSCVNPDHLLAGTQKQNAEDRAYRNRDLKSPAGINRSKTHCINGHEFTPENTYTRYREGGGRICKTCNHLNMRKRKGYVHDGTKWIKASMETSRRSDRKSK